MISKVHHALSGKKTHLLMLGGMVIVAANRLGLIPYVGIASGDWLPDEFKLAGVMVIRSALARVELAIANLAAALKSKPKR